MLQLKILNENEKRNLLKKKNNSSSYLNINKKEKSKSNLTSYINFTSSNNNCKVNNNIDEKIFKSMELAKKTLDIISKRSIEHLNMENYYNKIKEEI